MKKAEAAQLDFQMTTAYSMYLKKGRIGECPYPAFLRVICFNFSQYRTWLLTIVAVTGYVVPWKFPMMIYPFALSASKRFKLSSIN